MATPAVRRCVRLLPALFALLLFAAPLRAADAPAKVYVILWFDTEDYLLPASDDAALRVADLLTREKVRATFKVVGEKARTLERRGRTDVIEALRKHEIGYHSNFHSVQPTPAMYLYNLGWDEGVAEFDRREGPGFHDVKRIFGQTPSCYGQPGSSWGPQSFGAMRKWGMEIYLDAGSHVQLDGRPHYYCGVLTLYRLSHTIRADLNNPKELDPANERFAQARKQLLAEGGGVVSIFYHPCEWVHKEFWDGVNFRNGANPPREQWKLPRQKTEEESKLSYRIFEDYVRFMKRFPDVEFITATEAAKLYRDKARGRGFTADELKAVAANVKPDVTFQRHGEYTLSAGEAFALLNAYVAGRGAGQTAPALKLERSFYGPTEAGPPLAAPLDVSWSQFRRTAADVAEFLEKQGRIPSAVWCGSVPVPPEAYLHALARVSESLLGGKEAPAQVRIEPARLAAAEYVSPDKPELWGWVIFPPGFRAPAMMRLAKRQAWTIKPALPGAGVRP